MCYSFGLSYFAGSSFNIIVNGNGSWVKMSQRLKGLTQGGSLSPFLVTIMVDGFSRVVDLREWRMSFRWGKFWFNDFLTIPR